MQQLTVTSYISDTPLSIGDRVSMPRYLSKNEKIRLWFTKNFARVMRIPIEIDEEWMRKTAYITNIAGGNSSCYTLGTEKPLIPEKPESQKPEMMRVSISLYWDNRLKRYSAYWSGFAGTEPALEIATDLPILNVDQPETKYWYAELHPATQNTLQA